MKIPSKLRVTTKKQIGGNPLGFAVIYKPGTQAYIKQKHSQDQWAYGHGYYEVGDSTMWIKGSRWESGVLVGFNERVEDIYQPRIIDNVPTEGFRIVRSVSRDRGNKLCRVLDPRGFELEIAIADLMDIIHGGSIVDGLIVGPCIWRTGKILERVEE